MSSWQPERYVDYQGLGTHGADGVDEYWAERVSGFCTPSLLAEAMGCDEDDEAYLELVDDGLVAVSATETGIIFPNRQFIRNEQGVLGIRFGVSMTMERMRGIGIHAPIDECYPDDAVDLWPRGTFTTAWTVMANIFTNNRKGGLCLVEGLESNDWATHCEAYSDLSQLVDYLHTSRPNTVSTTTSVRPVPN